MPDRAISAKSSLTQIRKQSRGKRETGGIAFESDLRRRIVYLMIFRLVLISLILIATIALTLVSKRRALSTGTGFLFGIMAMTYLLTIVYAILLPTTKDPVRLGLIQIVADLLITSVLVHLTGGAQSAYTFLFPLSIISAAQIRSRSGAVTFGIIASLLFVVVGILGYTEILPTPQDQWVLPYGFSSISLMRSLVLNLLAFAGVGFLAYSLAGEIQVTKASLASERAAAADFLAIHEDIVRSLDSGLVTIDSGGAIMTMNETARTILENERGIGSHYAEVFPGLEEQLAHLSVDESLRRSDLFLQKGGEEIMLGISVSPLRGKTGVIGRVINFQDLTELKRMEKQVKETERLANLGSLAAGVAHEIRNPLAAISGSVELLSTEPGRSKESRALMSIVTKEIDRLNELITDLLDYTNPTKKEEIEFDLRALIEETIRVARQSQQDKQVQVDFLPGEGSHLISGDPGKMRQVVWNLLNNAIEASIEADFPEVEIITKPDSTGCTVEISDNGLGINPADRSRVFDPFFSTKARGTGLGLATCHSIISEHNGTVWVESEPGKGATFTFILPKSNVVGENGVQSNDD